MAHDKLTAASWVRESSAWAVVSEVMALLSSMTSRLWRAFFSKFPLAPSMTNLASSDILFLGITEMLMIVGPKIGKAALNTTWLLIAVDHLVCLSWVMQCLDTRFSLCLVDLQRAIRTAACGKLCS